MRDRHLIKTVLLQDMCTILDVRGCCLRAATIRNITYCHKNKDTIQL